ncbi:PREDICTED: nudC domain-containing protein 3, partial [Eurypyga helias]|uniref:nudC domain-containing protein 3 n=1 Tax=Eurypyga helias TaxID=54383 RepID=UPI0005284351
MRCPPKIAGLRLGAHRCCRSLVLPGEKEQNRPRARVAVTGALRRREPPPPRASEAPQCGGVRKTAGRGETWSLGLSAPQGHSSPAPPITRQEQFQTDPDSYNGAVRENYAWSQDYSDLEIKVPVPKHIMKGKQVSVDISSSAIRVAVLEGGSQRVLMEGKLTHKINTESSLWSLEPGKCVLAEGGNSAILGLCPPLELPVSLESRVSKLPNPLGLNANTFPSSSFGTFAVYATARPQREPSGRHRHAAALPMPVMRGRGSIHTSSHSGWCPCGTVPEPRPQ